MISVSNIYSQICTILMEPLPTGLSTGTLTEQDFLNIFSDIIQDFVERASLIKQLINIPAEGGVNFYTQPDYALSIQEILYDEKYMYLTDSLELDALLQIWRNMTEAVPRRWVQDRTMVNTFEIVGAPLWDGYTVTMTAPLYGTLSSISSVNDFTFTTSAPLYGTISSYTGPMYLESGGGMLLGTISDMVSSNHNLVLVSPVKPSGIDFSLSNIIEFVLDSFTPYIKYGILAKIFEIDGEMRDVLRARYCKARYEEGILLAKAIAAEAVEA
jgi:hypothetical protein